MQKLRGEFENPQYITQIAAQLRQDIGDMDRLAHVWADATLREIAHQEASTKRHVNIIYLPCRELLKHESGSSKTSWKRHLAGKQTTYYYMGWMDHMATYREHRVRPILELDS